ncbi:hypothetical protein KSS87_012551 [Heliosperma pusillum]|nr:hypothetical protein KSS87_012551 [Heliosperma pusillum]
MAAIAVSSYRDRTAEFRSLTETLYKIQGTSSAAVAAAASAVNDLSPDQPSSSSSSSSSSTKSEFNKTATRIGSGINEATRKISRLSQLAKKSSLFDDPTAEIQQLTALIKDDIRALNVAFTELQSLQNTEIANNYSDDTTVHANAICDDVKNKLMAATKQFQEVLTARTHNIKAHETRKQIFSANASRDNPFTRQATPMTEPPPWSNSSNVPAAQTTSGGVQAGSQLRRRLPTENLPSNDVEMQMLQQVAPQQEEYSHTRASGLQNVESTISELGGIFTHLAAMVAHQGELAIRPVLSITVLSVALVQHCCYMVELKLTVSGPDFTTRIDDNMEESLGNVEGAHSALLKHLTRISSNRSLLLKLFAILIFFLVIFIFFIV